MTKIVTVVSCEQLDLWIVVQAFTADDKQQCPDNVKLSKKSRDFCRLHNTALLEEKKHLNICYHSFPVLHVQFCSPVRITNGLLTTARNILKVMAEEKDSVGWFVRHTFVLWQHETNQFVFKNVSFSKPENCHSLLTKKGSYWTRKDWMFLSIIELIRSD